MIISSGFLNDMSFVITNCKEVELGDKTRGYFNWNSNPKKPYNVFNFIQLWHVSDGCGSVKLTNGQSMPIEKGKTYLIFPGTVCQTFCDEYMKQFYIDFKIEGLPLPIQQLFNFNTQIDNNPLTYSLLSEINERLYTENKTISNVFHIANCLKCLISQFIITQKRNWLDFEKFSTVLSFINENYSQKITLEELSNVAGYSKSHFSSLFKKAFGKSVMEYVESKRINVAQNLLIDSNFNIQEISDMTGFTDPLYFSKVFKKNVKSSPLKYRNDVREATAKDKIIY